MEQKKLHVWTLRFDGGASPNPGKASCAFKATSDSGAIIERSWRMDGIHTNNEAEWEAVTVGIETLMVADPDATLIRVIGDSELVVLQLTGVYNVKNRKLRPYKDRISKIEKENDVTIIAVHVNREFNEEMDKACKEAR